MAPRVIISSTLTLRAVFLGRVGETHLKDSFWGIAWPTGVTLEAGPRSQEVAFLPGKEQSESRFELKMNFPPINGGRQDGRDQKVADRLEPRTGDSRRVVEEVDEAENIGGKSSGLGFLYNKKCRGGKSGGWNECGKESQDSKDII